MKFEAVKERIAELGKQFRESADEFAYIEDEARECIYDFLVAEGLSIPDVDLDAFNKDDEDGNFIYEWTATVSDLYEKAENDADCKANLPSELVMLLEWMDHCFGW